MNVWAISDLHLSFARPDRRERYAARWRDHAARIEEHWRSAVDRDDLVLLPGDLSMARNHRDLQPDLVWLDRLPGTKVLAPGKPRPVVERRREDPADAPQIAAGGRRGRARVPRAPSYAEPRVLAAISEPIRLASRQDVEPALETLRHRLDSGGPAAPSARRRRSTSSGITRHSTRMAFRPMCRAARASQGDGLRLRAPAQPERVVGGGQRTARRRPLLLRRGRRCRILSAQDRPARGGLT